MNAVSAHEACELSSWPIPKSNCTRRICHPKSMFISIIRQENSGLMKYILNLCDESMSFFTVRFSLLERTTPQRTVIAE